MTDTTYTSTAATALADEFIAQSAKHLTSEFEKGRIVGTDYSQAYTALLQTSLQQAIQFLLSRDASALQADILNEQKLQAQDATALSNDTLAAKVSLTNNQLTISDEQATQASTDTLIKSEQLDQALTQGKLLDNQYTVSEGSKDAQIAGMVAQATIAEEQAAQAAVDTLMKTEQSTQQLVQGDILDAQKEVALGTKDAQITLATNQATVSTEQVAQAALDTSLKTEQLAQSNTQGDLLDNQLYVSNATKESAITGKATEVSLLAEDLLIKQERHGINRTPL